MVLLKHSATQALKHVNGSSRTAGTHVFKEVIPWRNPSKLAEHLVQNVIYKEDGLVVFNKPFGVGSSSKGSEKQYLNAAPVGEKVFSIYDALPYVAKSTGYETLHIASVPERYTSGVTILAKSEQLRKRVKDSLQLSKVSNDTMNLYYALVVGSPNVPNGSFQVGIQMSSKVPNQPILVPHTKTGVRHQSMHSVRVEYETLSSSNLATLLSIRSSTSKLNALRIVCTDKFVSPILGDNMFGSRVQNVLGRDVLIGFNPESARKPMKLRKEVLEALGLSSGEELIIPHHLHLQEVYLANYLGSELILRSPLPSVFQWSCEKLGLAIPECKPCEKLTRRDVLSKNRGEERKQENGEVRAMETTVSL